MRSGDVQACGRKGGGPRRKIWKASKAVWNPCNPLKSHKTTKALFGKAWSKTREFWRSLEKGLEGALIPPPSAPTGGLRPSWLRRAKLRSHSGVAFVRERRSSEAVRPAKGGLSVWKSVGTARDGVAAWLALRRTVYDQLEVRAHRETSGRE